MSQASPRRLNFLLPINKSKSRRFGQKVKNSFLIILEMGIRRGRHDAKFRDATFADLSLLPIRIDLETDRHAWANTAKIACRHRLTHYDAAYLELARRRGLPLASLDSDLRKAAKLERIPILGA